MDIRKEVYTKVVMSRKFLMDTNLRYENLFSTVHEMVEVDCNNFVYEIKSLLNASRKIVKLKIKNDRDVQFAIEKLMIY